MDRELATVKQRIDELSMVIGKHETQALPLLPKLSEFE